MNGIALLCALHVHIHLRERHIQVEAEMQDGARQQYNKHAEGCVLKVGQLDLHRSELDAPADPVARRRRLEAHRLPVGRLQVFKVVVRLVVILIDKLRKNHQRVAHK